MADASASRLIGELGFEDVRRLLGPESIVCLPLGAFEQHGPHLPLGTDTVIAEELTRRVVARHADTFDLWQLPAVSVGLSREHAWAAGTMSLSVTGFTGLLRDIGAEIPRTLPTRNLLVVNGHGGNRGILDAVIYEWQFEFGLNACVVHPLALSGAEEQCEFPDIHGGKIETSLMLAIAPHLVRLERLTEENLPERAEVQRMILDRGASFGWTSGDARIARRGVTGAARDASAAFGEKVLRDFLDNIRQVLQELREAGRARR